MNFAKKKKNSLMKGTKLSHGDSHGVTQLPNPWVRDSEMQIAEARVGLITFL